SPWLLALARYLAADARVCGREGRKVGVRVAWRRPARVTATEECREEDALDRQLLNGPKHERALLEHRLRIEPHAHLAVGLTGRVERELLFEAVPLAGREVKATATQARSKARARRHVDVHLALAVGAPHEARREAVRAVGNVATADVVAAVEAGQLAA